MNFKKFKEETEKILNKYKENGDKLALIMANERLNAIVDFVEEPNILTEGEVAWIVKTKTMINLLMITEVCGKEDK